MPLLYRPLCVNGKIQRDSFSAEFGNIMSFALKLEDRDSFLRTWHS